MSNWAAAALEARAYKLEKITIAATVGPAFMRRLSPAEHGELFETIMSAIPEDETDDAKGKRKKKPPSPAEIKSQILASQSVCLRCWYEAEVPQGQEAALEAWLKDETGKVAPPKLTRGGPLLTEEMVAGLDMDELGELTGRVTAFSGVGKEVAGAAAHFPAPPVGS
jgi:hypothetical protein